MWHEARRSERKVHDMMDAARKRAQRRAVFLAKRRGDPQQSIQVMGARCRTYRDDGLYQASQDQQGLISWNGKDDILIDRFDGRALLDFIREAGSRNFRAQEKSQEDEELDEFVNFERYRDLIKHRRRGLTDEEGLYHVNQEMEAKVVAPFMSDRTPAPQPSASKVLYTQVGFSYGGAVKEEDHSSEADDDDDDDEEDEEDDFNSDDSSDEEMEKIAQEFGVKRYGYLVYLDKKAKEEEKRQKEVIKGNPAIRKLSRKERRKVSQVERERDRETARISGTHVLHHDPYREPRRSPTYDAYPRLRRSRSRSRSYSPLHSRRYSRGRHSDDSHQTKQKAPKIEYITEFGGTGSGVETKFEAYSPPRSPPSQAMLNRQSSGQILEALHLDPASGVSLGDDKSSKVVKPTTSTSSTLAKLTKSTCSGLAKQPQVEKKETPQERLKRIMSRQLNKQIKKDTAAELTKKREQERQRQEKLAETSRVSQYGSRSRSRSHSRSPSRRYRHSRSPTRSRTSRKHQSRSPSHSMSRSPDCQSRSNSYSRSPRRSRSRY